MQISAGNVTKPMFVRDIEGDYVNVNYISSLRQNDNGYWTGIADDVNTYYQFSNENAQGIINYIA